MTRNEYSYNLPPHKVVVGLVLAVTALRVDPLAQRTLNERRAAKMAEDGTFIPEAIGTIVVSGRRNRAGKIVYYIVDGMHRWRCCVLRGDIASLTCEVHFGLTRKEEAVLFLIKNRESVGTNPQDEYKIGLTGGVEQFVDTEKVVRAHGLMVGSSSAGSIGAIRGLLHITEEYGTDTLDRTLTVAELAWGRTQATWDGILLAGLSRFLYLHGQIATDHELAAKLSKQGPADMWRSKVLARVTFGGIANSGTSSRASAAYLMMVEAWNKGRRSIKNQIVL